MSPRQGRAWAYPVASHLPGTTKAALFLSTTPEAFAVPPHWAVTSARTALETYGAGTWLARLRTLLVQALREGSRIPNAKKENHSLNIAGIVVFFLTFAYLFSPYSKG